MNFIDNYSYRFSYSLNCYSWSLSFCGTLWINSGDQASCLSQVQRINCLEHHAPSKLAMVSHPLAVPQGLDWPIHQLIFSCDRFLTLSSSPLHNPPSRPLLPSYPSVIWVCTQTFSHSPWFASSFQPSHNPPASLLDPSSFGSTTLFHIQTNPLPPQ